MPTYEELASAAQRPHRTARARCSARSMGLVALTVGCTALGRLHRAQSQRRHRPGAVHRRVRAASSASTSQPLARHEQLAIALLFGLGLLLGMAVGPVLAVYAKAEPAVLWQAAGATAGFVGALGAYGYATRRDLSSWARTLFWALLA